jgi:hypothetical protein
MAPGRSRTRAGSPTRWPPSPRLSSPRPGQAASSGAACRPLRPRFNPARAGTDPGPAATAALAWAWHHCLPLGALADPAVTRQALEALVLRLDGTRAAAATTARKRAVFHGCLGYAAQLGLLEANPLDHISWQSPRSSCPAGPQSAPHLPRCRRSWLRSPRSAGADRVLRLRVLRGAAPRRSRRPPRQLLHPPLTRLGPADPHRIPAPVGGPGPATARHANRAPSNTGRKAPAGRSRSPRSLPASCAGTCGPSGAPQMGGCSRVPAAARSAKASTAGSGARPAPQPCRRTGQAPSRCAAPATCAMPRCRCGWPPGGPPAEIAARAGHSVRVLLTTYTHGIPGCDQIASQHIEQALRPSCWPPAGPQQSHADAGNPVRHASAPQLDPAGHSWT